MELNEKAKSRAQQRFFGMVRAAQKGEGAASPEVAKVASEISKKDAKDFAKTKHKGLPEKKKVEEAAGCDTTKITNKGKKKVNPKKNPVIEDVTLQDANGNDFLEIIDLIKPDPIKKIANELEDNKSTIEEDVSYKAFTAKAREITSKMKKEKQEKQKRNAESAYRDKVTKGVKFYDKKGKGHIRGGKKVYD